MTNLKRAIAGVDLYADTVDPAKIERIQKVLDAGMAALEARKKLRVTAESFYSSSATPDFLKDLFGIRK